MPPRPTSRRSSSRSAILTAVRRQSRSGRGLHRLHLLSPRRHGRSQNDLDPWLASGRARVAVTIPAGLLGRAGRRPHGQDADGRRRFGCHGRNSRSRLRPGGAADGRPRWTAQRLPRTAAEGPLQPRSPEPLLHGPRGAGTDHPHHDHDAVVDGRRPRDRDRDHGAAIW